MKAIMRQVSNRLTELGDPKWKLYMKNYGATRRKAGLSDKCSRCGKSIEGDAVAMAFDGVNNQVFCPDCYTPDGSERRFPTPGESEVEK